MPAADPRRRTVYASFNVLEVTTVKVLQRRAITLAGLVSGIALTAAPAALLAQANGRAPDPNATRFLVPVFRSADKALGVQAADAVRSRVGQDLGSRDAYVLTKEDIEAIADVARENDITVLADEIYGRLVYDGEQHSIAAMPGMAERTIVLDGFSKAYAMTGWRVGYLAAPAAILEGIVKVHQYGIMSAPTTAQDAALAAVMEGEADVERMRAEYDRRRRLLVDGLNALGLETFEPRGAFYAFPRIGSTGLDDETFAERLLTEERVAAVPGSAFGPSGAGHVRMCYATSYERLEEALVRIGRFVERARAAVPA